MWSARPFNSDMPDPFGRNVTRNAEGQLVAESVKCPACGSNIFFRPEVQGMLCRNCGNIYHPSTLEKMGSLGYSIEHDYTGDNEISEDDKKRHEIVCNSCGATVIADENMMSTMCAFCGSPALITRRMTREFKPDYIIPFKIDKRTAENNMKQWLKTRKMTPRGFKTKSRLTKMEPFYVPFWILDCAVNTDMYGIGKKYTKDKTALFSVRAKANYYVKGVPFDASLKIANKLMEAIEPFDFNALIPYDYRYLPGFYADRYDQSPQDLAARATKRGMDGIDKALKGSLKGAYDRFNIKQNLSRIDSMEANYALLPVWFMSYKYRNKYYYFAMNGQTGEVAGQLPVSPVKKLMFFFIVLGILAVITRFVLGIIMRGFWG